LYGSEALSRTFFSINNRFRDFFGIEHASALVRLIGPAHLPLFIRECLKIVEEKIINVIAEYYRYESGCGEVSGRC